MYRIYVIVMYVIGDLVNEWDVRSNGFGDLDRIWLKLSIFFMFNIVISYLLDIGFIGLSDVCGICNYDLMILIIEFKQTYDWFGWEPNP
jgi:hypothetical protein